MQRRSKLWVFAGVLTLVAVWVIWLATSLNTPVRDAASASSTASVASVLTPVPPSVPTNALAPAKRQWLDYVVKNTGQPLAQLKGRDTVIDLENALIDTTTGAPLDIPEHLRAEAEPGAYVVQSRTAIDDQFRALLKRSGGTPVSYVPNNAWLVQATDAQAQWLRAQSSVRAVVAWEPYFKLKTSLLPLAVEKKPLSVGAYLNVLLFDGLRPQTLAALDQLGAKVVSQAASPFGEVVTVQPRPQSLPDLARLPGVQLLERAYPRELVNDLSRVRVNVSTNTTNALNYLSLTGTNVTVAIVDSGVDSVHPDLAGRVILDRPSVGIDTDGHGTHVAGTVAGSGAASGTVSNNIPGSVTGANYRGKAPGAGLFALELGFSPTNGLEFDAYVQQQAARSNAIISQNSWGYVGDSSYNIASASYDAAVRDSLPFAQGSQPITYVFSAGNDGDAADNGLSGFADSVSSPGNAKNVITVGALEQLRNITNEVVNAGITNKPWEAQTDTDNEVAGYSSRGNVGIAVEGLYGRFKPDVVAPGTFVISTRSKDWDEAAYYNITNVFESSFEDLELPVSDELEIFSEFGFPGTVEIRIAVTNMNPPVDLPIYVRAGDFPTKTQFDSTALNGVTIAPVTGFETYYYGIANPTNVPVTYDIVTTLVITNDLIEYYAVLKQLNDQLAPHYRYETGTSMASPTVSGMLALMQEYYSTRMGVTNSPALMKALLINGARSASSLYDLQVQTTINHQGWGLVNLPTSLPPTDTGAITNAESSFQFFEQSPSDALVTGQSKSRTVTLASGGIGRPLRFSLVWTDPPGNPAAGVKLVNDLDLIVTNLTSGEVYYGNDIPSGTDFTSATLTNTPPNRDFVNNVENVYLADPQGTNTQFSVTVVGRRVNVNAVTAHPDNVAQDYALVISSGNGEVTNAFTVVDGVVAGAGPFNLTIVTNTVDSQLPLLGQKVGANSPLIASPTVPFTNRLMQVGVTNQWRFYVATNYGTNINYTNAAFVTFLPPTLSTPRLGPWSPFQIADEISRPEADIDMYVSTNAALTNLIPAELQNAWSSIGRGGTEIVTLSNSAPDQVYYIGIKSEDQMGGEYAFFALFSDVPFSERDSEGNIIIRGLPVPNQIPDGDNANPGVSLVLGISTETDTIRKVTVTNTLTHEQMGDLFANLSHNTDFAVLHNHSFGNGDLTQRFIYDDSDDGLSTDSQRTDGPGSLNNFQAGDAVGLWLLTTLDDSPSATGRVESLTIKVEPQRILDEGDVLTIGARRFGRTFVEVPAGATNLSISVTNISDQLTPAQQKLPVELYVRRENPPTLTAYDYRVTVEPPGGTNTLEIGLNDLPPLQPGIYYIGVFNPNPVPQRVIVWARIDLDLDSIVPFVFTNTAVVPLIDDAVTTNTIYVPTNLTIAQVDVGVRLNHPRVSDLALQLVSPQGKRVLLFENRGNSNPPPANLGGDLPQPDPIGVNSSGRDTNAFSTNINVVVNSGEIRVEYDFQTIPDTLTVYGLASNLVFGPVTLSNAGYVDFNYNEPTNFLTFVINEAGNSNSNTVWSFTITRPPAGFAYATFTEDTNKVSEPQSLLKFVPPPFTVPNPNYVLTNKFTNGIYYLPEESLEAIKNETAEGDWTLEIWDSRAGNPLTGPAELLSWKLEFVLLPAAIPFIVVEPYVPTNGVVASSNWTYLVVDVPSWATAATNYFSTSNGAPVNVWFSQSGIPTGTNASDVLLFNNLSAGVTNLTTNGTPPLVPGDRYYIGIFNPNPTPVTFTYQVDFDIVTLTNGIPFNGVQPLGGTPRYFAFNVTTNATVALFELTNMLGGDLDLFVRQGALPTFFNYDYFSINPGTIDESVIAFTNDVTNPLVPGRYFLGIYNNATNAVSYSIVATEFTNAFPDIITLTNGIAYSNASAALPGTSQFYRYTVTTNANRAQFEIFGATGDFTLLAVRGLPLPTFANYDYRSANPGLNDELIVVITNSTPVNLAAGDWFLSAFKISGGAASYNIMATEWPETGRPVRITDSGVNGTDYCLTWISVPGAHYNVLGFNGTWNFVTNVTAVDFTTSLCIPLSLGYNLFQVVEGLELQPAAPLPAVITTLIVAPGSVTLGWFGPVTGNFVVEWTDSLSPASWQVDNSVVNNGDGTFTYVDDGTTTTPFTGARYYRVVQLP